MPRRLIAAALTAGTSISLIVLLATPALAKGPTQARITGPGLNRAIVISGQGEPGQQGQLATLAGQTGLFTVLFGGGVSTGAPALVPLRDAPQKASLGPRYTLTYTVPGLSGPDQMNGQLRQDLYPDAGGGPVIYTPPGQPSWVPHRQTAWMRGGPRLRGLLGRLGVPAAAPPQAGNAVASHPAGRATPPAQSASPAPAAGIATWLIATMAIIAATALAGSALLLRRRSRVGMSGIGGR
jgi:hypothetical protein